MLSGLLTRWGRGKSRWRLLWWGLRGRISFDLLNNCTGHSNNRIDQQRWLQFGTSWYNWMPRCNLAWTQRSNYPNWCLISANKPPRLQPVPVISHSYSHSTYIAWIGVAIDWTVDDVGCRRARVAGVTFGGASCLDPVWDENSWNKETTNQLLLIQTWLLRRHLLPKSANPKMAVVVRFIWAIFSVRFTWQDFNLCFLNAIKFLLFHLNNPTLELHTSLARSLKWAEEWLWKTKHLIPQIENIHSARHSMITIIFARIIFENLSARAPNS